MLLEEDAAWPRFCQAVDRFLGVPANPSAFGTAPHHAIGSLTPREREILAAVALAGSNAEIARALHISQKTVRNHLTSIFEKLGVDSRAKAIVPARDLGLDGP